MALAGMVLGIVAVVVASIPCVGLLAVVPGVVAIVLAVIGLSQSKKTGKGKGMAKAGLICGIVACVWALVFNLLILSGAEITVGDEESVTITIDGETMTPEEVLERANRELEETEAEPSTPAPAPE